MKYITNSLKIMVLGLSTFNVHAVTVQECVGENNERIFQKICPPGTTTVNTVKLQTGKRSKSAEQGPSDVSITLYAVPKCDSCDVMRLVLEKYNASFTEVNIENNIEKQNELMEIIGAEGSLKVPTIIFGEKQITGFDKATLVSELEAAGFKEKGKEDAEANQQTDEGTEKSDAAEGKT